MKHTRATQRHDKPLSPKHARFVAEYLKDFNGRQAAIRSGYSRKGAEVLASRLLRKANVAAALESAKAKAVQKAELTAARVLEEIRRLAFSDIRDIFDAKGRLRPVHEWPEEVASAIAAVEVQNGRWLTKVKRWDKPRALELLAKHFGLVKEQHEHSGTLKLDPVMARLEQLSVQELRTLRAIAAKAQADQT